MPDADLGLASAAGSKDAPLVAPFTLRLTNPDGDIIEVPATNYYLEPDGDVRSPVAQLAQTILNRTPEVQARLGKLITSTHANAEMSFRVKDPETGAYDKVFEVPCHPNPVPLSKKHYDLLVESTGSVMRALRDMLQIFYANPNATAEELGLGDLPEEEKQRVLETIRGSVYFEPALVGPEMAEYPFLSVGGFDAAVGDLDRPDPVFFEYNLGTPSGLSNNIQLQEALRTVDPEVYQTIRDRLPADDTFKLLREAIESNALAWTKNPAGISVVLSPGVANGAHPDVASIAHYSGMPLVNPSDLYEDKHGHIRLNVEGERHHPLVTGIYGRMEESYFLQNCDDGIPIRDPHLAEEEDLSERLGVPLEPGVVYQFEYDAEDKIVGVKKDEEGKPLLQPVFESIGRDPARPDEKPGSFARAIKSRNLYYSGLGGRIVDDKRVFQAVSRYVAPKYTRRPDEPIARPPRTLDVSEYETFYESDRLEDFVVKEPDRSGGDGVNLMCNLTEEKRRKVVEDVRKNPGRFIVQDMVPSAVMLSPEETDSKEMAYGTRMTDWRIFSMMDANGNVGAGPNSLLLRVANVASASTNTSQGGGYGIGVILDDTEDRGIRGKDDSLLPTPPVHRYLSTGKADDLRSWIELFNMATGWADPAVGGEFNRNGNATMLADRQRSVMELLGRQFAPSMALLRSYDQGEVEAKDIHLDLLDLRAALMRHKDFPVEGVAEVVHSELARYRPFELKEVSKLQPPPKDELLSQVTMKPIAEPVEVMTLAGPNDSVVSTFETAVYQNAPKEVKKAAAALAQFGGEVRYIQSKDLGTGAWQDMPPPAYFRVENGRPIIGLDVCQERALSMLAHQMAYFEVWQNNGEALFNDISVWKEAERKGIAAEMKKDADQSVFNRSVLKPPSTPLDQGYARRLNHPAIEAVRAMLVTSKNQKVPLDRRTIRGYLRKIAGQASRFGSERRAFLSRKLMAPAGPMSKEQRRDRLRQLALLDSLNGMTAFEQSFDPETLALFERDGTDKTLRALFDESVCDYLEPGMFVVPEEVAKARDTLDERLEAERISRIGRVILGVATAATAVQGNVLAFGPAAEINVTRGTATQRTQ